MAMLAATKKRWYLSGGTHTTGQQIMAKMMNAIKSDASIVPPASDRFTR